MTGRRYGSAIATIPLGTLCAALDGASCKSLIAGWDRSYDALRSLADNVDSARGIPADRARLLTLIRFPDKLLAVGADNLRLYSLEIHGPELPPDEDNPWF